MVDLSVILILCILNIVSLAEDFVLRPNDLLLALCLWVGGTEAIDVIDALVELGQIALVWLRVGDIICLVQFLQHIYIRLPVQSPVNQTKLLLALVVLLTRQARR